MKKTGIILLTALIIISALLCSCTQRKRVTIIQNEQKKPEERKKNPAEDDLPEEYYDNIRAEFTDDALIIRYPDSELTVPYDKIDEFSYSASFDYEKDNLTEGSETEYTINGKMRSEDGQEYYMQIYKTTAPCIEICFGATDIVFNLRSADATRECYETLKAKKG